MLKSCPYCGRIHPKGDRCKARPARKKGGNREAERFRSTYAWAKKREEVGARDHYLCRVCLADEHRITCAGIEAHHILPLEETMDYALDADWIISLCVRHHKLADRGDIHRERLHHLATQPVSPLPGAKKQGEGSNTTGCPRKIKDSQNESEVG